LIDAVRRPRGNKFAVMAQCPEYVIPIGQVPFQSLISHKEEMTPVSVKLLAMRGFE